ncbi:hypothetical protein [Ectobacillus antri]|uniref:hypothetical protein n=1 Tax=Ectobacillus antri TaxID=2486280 RepID=UPI000F5A59E3|nr:hypothetical protein [Ectobacillus antri]
MASVFSIGTSTPATGSNSINRTLSTTPILLAEFGIGIPNGSNRVILNATIGISALLLNPTIIITVARDQQVIFTSREELQISVGENRTVSVQAIDVNVPATGNQRYVLTAQLAPGLLNGSSVTGPVTFSAVSYSV